MSFIFSPRSYSLLKLKTAVGGIENIGSWLFKCALIYILFIMSFPDGTEIRYVAQNKFTDIMPKLMSVCTFPDKIN